MISRVQKDSMNMARKSSFALLALGISTTACTVPQGGPGAYIPNPSMNSVNQPVVQRTDYVFDASTSGNGISGDELARLNDWFQSLELGYGDRISIDDMGYGDPVARSDIESLAASYGLLLSNHVPLTAGSIRPGSVRVIVSRATASVPNCPNWSDRNSWSSPIDTASNYGCGVNSNLAAMVANPSDLVLGQAGDGTGDAATAAKAIRVYRNAEPTGKAGLQETSTKGD
jgi:pilus assembly protein CpaD